MKNPTQSRKTTLLAAASGLTLTVAANTAGAFDFYSEDSAYWACVDKIEREVKDVGLIVEQPYGRSAERKNRAFTFWINTTTKDPQTGKPMQMRARCESKGFGRVVSIDIKGGRWTL